MLKIGAFSALSRISVRMLRYYDENGLLRPSHIDRFTGYRYYDESQLAEACRIALLRDMGFGVASISAILHGGREAYRSALRQQRAELLRRRDEVTAQLILLEKALYRTEKEENPMEKYQVVCKTLPERYVASVRDILPDYFYEGRLWHTLMQETAGLNLVPVEPCAFGIYHDGEYREHDVDVEIQFAVQPGAYADTAHVQFKTVPPVLVASAVHHGSYQTINAANIAVAEWAQRSGYEFAGMSFSIYHVSPAQTSNPDELVTEVCYPVRLKAKD